jgi:hypothetical protein
MAGAVTKERCVKKLRRPARGCNTKPEEEANRPLRDDEIDALFNELAEQQGVMEARKSTTCNTSDQDGKDPLTDVDTGSATLPEQAWSERLASRLAECSCISEARVQARRLASVQAPGLLATAVQRVGGGREALAVAACCMEVIARHFCGGAPCARAAFRPPTPGEEDDTRCDWRPAMAEEFAAVLMPIWHRQYEGLTVPRLEWDAMAALHYVRMRRGGAATAECILNACHDKHHGPLCDALVAVLPRSDVDHFARLVIARMVATLLDDFSETI